MKEEKLRIWGHAQNLDAEDTCERIDEQVRETIDACLTFEDTDMRWRLIQAIERAVHPLIRKSIPWWRHGRAWLHCDSVRLPWIPARWRGPILGVSWSFGWACRLTHAYVELGSGLSDHDLTISLAVKRLFGIWLSTESVLPRAWVDGIDGRELGLSIHDGSIWWKLWSSDNEWRSKAPFSDYRSSKRQPVWHVVDWLLGKDESEKRTIGTVKTELVMPEGVYPLTLTFEEWSWRRKRWPKVSTIRRVHAEMGVPLPIPGKGENSWDLDDDAIYSSTFCAMTVPEALEYLAKSTLKTRQRYGGRNWVPDAPMA